MSDDIHDMEKKTIMQAAVDKSTVCVCFTPSMRDVAWKTFSAESAKNSHFKTLDSSTINLGYRNDDESSTITVNSSATDHSQKISFRHKSMEDFVVIPQAVTVNPDGNFDFFSLLNEEFGIPIGSKIILLVACMRKGELNQLMSIESVQKM